MPRKRVFPKFQRWNFLSHIFCYERKCHFQIKRKSLKTSPSYLLTSVFICSFIFGGAGSSLLHTGSLWLWWVGLLFIAVCGLLTVVAFLVLEHGLWGVQASVVVTRGLSSTGSTVVAAELSSSAGMWDLSGSGIEPMTPALAGWFFTFETPGKPLTLKRLDIRVEWSVVAVQILKV